MLPAELDIAVRGQIYDHIFSAGRVPSPAELAQALALPAPEISAALHRLADTHMLVLAWNSDDIVMANPFSAVAPPFPVTVDGRLLYGNCIWDALGIAAKFGRDAVIAASCGCCAAPLPVTISGGAASAAHGLAHFALPAARWWDDITYT